MTFIPRKHTEAIRLVATLVGLIELGLSVWAFANYKGDVSHSFAVLHQEFAERVYWFGIDLGGAGKLNVEYYVALDGMNVAMVLLTGIVSFFSILASRFIKQKVRSYYSLVLLLTGTVMGCFLAMDLFLFYVCFEFVLLPLYFLIGLWGGEQREAAALKFFIYTLVGSLMILLGIIMLYFGTPVRIESAQGILFNTFSIPDLTDANAAQVNGIMSALAEPIFLGFNLRAWVFLLIFVGFCIKVPVVPVHTWLPLAHTEAPAPVSAILAGLLLKAGTYGVMRIGFGILPDVAMQFASFISILGAVSIVYGAFTALAQDDVKRMIAYSSISHLGFVLIGLSSFNVEGYSGAMYQMFSHGVISALLFLLVGEFYERTHDRTISHYAGLGTEMPIFSVISGAAFFAALGMPLFSGFVAEITTLLGVFRGATQTGSLMYWSGGAALFGMLVMAGTFIYAYQRMFLGPTWFFNKRLSLLELDLDSRSLIFLVPLTLLTILFGVMPSILFDKITPTINEYLFLIP